jgi:hypothetical protein
MLQVLGFLLITVVNGCVNETIEDVLNSPHILHSNSTTPHVLRHRTCLLHSRLAASPIDAMPRSPSHVVDDQEGITESLLILSHYRVPEMQAPSIADFQNGRMHSPTVSNGGQHSALSPPEYLPLWLCAIFTRPSFTPRCSRLTQASSESGPERDGHKTISGGC